MPSIDELFAMMPNAFDVEKAKDLNATVQFDLSGEGGGQYYVQVAGGEVSTAKGTADSPTATIHMAADDYKKMVAGELNPVNAFMTQKIKVEGDLSTVMKFQTLFNN
ncbi:MAG: SCP2 sterol-binding domain-containing protein [Candidatus Promineifilaceae bacterium]